MAEITIPGMFLTGIHASRPAAAAVGVGSIYSCTTHGTLYQSDGATWSTWATLGGAAVTWADLDDDHDAHDHTGVPGVGGGSGGSDPILELFGAPTSAHEFDTSSLAALTAIGSPDAEDADTSVPDCYYISEASATALLGRYVTAPAEPFTAIAKITDSYPRRQDGRHLGCLIAGSTGLSGGVDVLKVRYLGSANGWHGHLMYWSGGTPGPNTEVQVGNARDPQFPHYLAVRANSTTSFDYFVSETGYVWDRVVSARNPGYAINVIGVGLALQGTAGHAAFDFLRIWDSAKTFLIAP